MLDDAINNFFIWKTSFDNIYFSVSNVVLISHSQKLPLNYIFKIIPLFKIWSKYLLVPPICCVLCFLSHVWLILMSGLFLQPFLFYWTVKLESIFVSISSFSLKFQSCFYKRELTINQLKYNSLRYHPQNKHHYFEIFCCSVN